MLFSLIHILICIFIGGIIISSIMIVTDFINIDIQRKDDSELQTKDLDYKYAVVKALTVFILFGCWIFIYQMIFQPNKKE